MKKTLWFCFSFILGWQIQAIGQNRGDIERILKAGTADLNTYMKGYIEPAAKGFAYSMGAGWMQTAETHSTFGFHIKASVSAAKVPSYHNTFTFNPADYNNIRVKGTTDNRALPTLFGPSESDATLQIYDRDLLIADVTVPPGTGLQFNYIPVPSFQAGFGLPAGTEVLLKVIPKSAIEDVKISQLGFGLKHNIKQHIPVIKQLPFSFSGLVAYNSLNVSYYFDQGAGQYGELQVSGWTFQALASKKLAFLTVYGTLGYNSGKSDFELMGTYKLEGPQETEPISIPVSLSYEASGPLASLGARLKLGPIFINGDYTFQEFNTITVGLGLSIK
ncbi:MAG: DUF6588 family protein [Anditalea sp.]